MTTRRRSPFPGVPAPGGNDPNETHAYPGLAAELRAEQPLERGDPVTVDLDAAGQGVHRLRVEDTHTDEDGTTHATLTPLDEQGEPTTPTWLPTDTSRISLGLDLDRDGRATSATLSPLDPQWDPLIEDEDAPAAPTAPEAPPAPESPAPALTAAMQRVADRLQGGPPEPTDGATGLDDRSADLPPADVDTWRAFRDGEPAWPEPTVPERPVGVERPVGPELAEPVELRLPCGCEIVVRCCRHA